VPEVCEGRGASHGLGAEVPQGGVPPLRPGFGSTEVGIGMEVRSLWMRFAVGIRGLRPSPPAPLPAARPHPRERGVW
jgi:hypothetical protein